MELVFTNKKLLALYETGSSTKYKLDQKVIRSFFEVVAVLEAAADIYDLWKLPSLHFEKLTGYENRYSARLDRKWRLELSIEWRNEALTVGVLALEDITNHYGG